MLIASLPHLCHLSRHGLAAVRARAARLARPIPLALVAGAAIDATRSKPELVLENALLRQQLAILVRNAKRPRLTALDRGFIVLLAS